jgi:hypothetical protein
MTDDVADFNARKFEQIRGDAAMAIAAVGIAITKALMDRDEPLIALESLRQHAGEAYDRLRYTGQTDAMVMFGTFTSALYDKSLFPPKDTAAS